MLCCHCESARLEEKEAYRQPSQTLSDVIVFMGLYECQTCKHRFLTIRYALDIRNDEMIPVRELRAVAKWKARIIRYEDE